MTACRPCTTAVAHDNFQESAADLREHEDRRPSPPRPLGNDPVLAPGPAPVAQFQVGQLPAAGAGGKAGEPVPAGVGEPQLRAGVRAFLADDHPHARRPGRQVQHAGDLGDPRARAHLAFAVVGRSLRSRGDLADGIVDLLGDGEPGRVGQPTSRLGQPGQELLGAAAAVGADQQLAAQGRRQLGPRLTYPRRSPGLGSRRWQQSWRFTLIRTTRCC